MGGATRSEIFFAFLLERQQRGQTVFPSAPLEEAFYRVYLKNPETMNIYGFNGNRYSLILQQTIRMSHLTGRIRINPENGLAKIGCLDGIAEPKEEVRAVAKSICDYLEINKTVI